MEDATIYIPPTQGHSTQDGDKTTRKTRDSTRRDSTDGCLTNVIHED